MEHKTLYSNEALAIGSIATLPVERVAAGRAAQPFVGATTEVAWLTPGEELRFLLYAGGVDTSNGNTLVLLAFRCHVEQREGESSASHHTDAKPVSSFQRVVVEPFRTVTIGVASSVSSLPLASPVAASSQARASASSSSPPMTGGTRTRTLPPVSSPRGAGGSTSSTSAGSAACTVSFLEAVVGFPFLVCVAAGQLRFFSTTTLSAVEADYTAGLRLPPETQALSSAVVEAEGGGGRTDGITACCVAKEQTNSSTDDAANHSEVPTAVIVRVAVLHGRVASLIECTQSVARHMHFQQHRSGADARDGVSRRQAAPACVTVPPGTSALAWQQTALVACSHTGCTVYDTHSGDHLYTVPSSGPVLHPFVHHVVGWDRWQQDRLPPPPPAPTGLQPFHLSGVHTEVGDTHRQRPSTSFPSSVLYRRRLHELGLLLVAPGSSRSSATSSMTVSLPHSHDCTPATPSASPVALDAYGLPPFLFTLSSPPGSSSRDVQVCCTSCLDAAPVAGRVGLTEREPVHDSAGRCAALTIRCDRTPFPSGGEGLVTALSPLGLFVSSTHSIEAVLVPPLLAELQHLTSTGAYTAAVALFEYGFRGAGKDTARRALHSQCAESAMRAHHYAEALEYFSSAGTSVRAVLLQWFPELLSLAQFVQRAPVRGGEAGGAEDRGAPAFPMYSALYQWLWRQWRSTVTVGREKEHSDDLSAEEEEDDAAHTRCSSGDETDNTRNEQATIEVALFLLLVCRTSYEERSPSVLQSHANEDEASTDGDGHACFFFAHCGPRLPLQQCLELIGVAGPHPCPTLVPLLLASAGRCAEALERCEARAAVHEAVRVLRCFCDGPHSTALYARHLPWMMDADLAVALTALTQPARAAPSPSRIVPLLLGRNAGVALWDYLHYVLYDQSDCDPALHTIYAVNLIDIARELRDGLGLRGFRSPLLHLPVGAEPGLLGRVRRALLPFLTESPHYDADVVLAYLLDTDLFEEQVAVYHRIGDDVGALSVLVHDMDNIDGAVTYCLHRHAEQVDAAAAAVRTSAHTNAFSSSDTAMGAHAERDSVDSSLTEEEDDEEGGDARRLADTRRALRAMAAVASEEEQARLGHADPNGARVLRFERKPSLEMLADVNLTLRTPRPACAVDLAVEQRELATAPQRVAVAAASADPPLAFSGRHWNYPLHLLLRVLLEPRVESETESLAPPFFTDTQQRPPPPQPQLLTTALELLHTHAEAFHPLVVLAMLPESTAVSAVAPFLLRSFGWVEAQGRLAQLEAAAAQCSVTDAVERHTRLRQRCVWVDANRVCVVCGDALGVEALLTVFPNLKTCHYRCQHDPVVDPERGVLFRDVL